MSVDKIIKLRRSHRRAMLLAVVLIAALGLYRWILAPYGSQLLAAEKYNYTLGSILRKTGHLDETLTAKKAKLEKLNAESDRLRNELVNTREVRGFFASLPALANSVGCVIQSVNADPEQRRGSENQTQDSSGIVANKTAVSITGGYGNIIRLLEELQAYPRKIWIDSVMIETDRNAGKLKCRLNLTLYCADIMEMASYE